MICERGSFKIYRIEAVADGFLLTCLLSRDADKLFNIDILTTIAEADFEPIIPVELKTKSLVILRNVEGVILSKDVSPIKSFERSSGSC